MPQVLVSILVFFSVVCLGSAALVLRAGRRRSLETRLYGPRGDRSVSEVSTGPRLADAFSKFGKHLAVGQASPRLQSEMVQAGYHNPAAARVYLGAKMLLMVLGMLIAMALLLPMERPLLQRMSGIMIVALSGFFVPNLVVYLKRHKRMDEVRNHLPDALDLLEICVSSGMGLDMAWNAVTEEVRRVSAVLADEMALTNMEMHLGAPRAEAMRHMAERTGETDISSLVAILVQSERFGTSVAEALRTFAQSMRQSRKTRAEESAEKMAVKMLIPMILFVFPAILIVLLGPAGIKIADAFSRW